jgi:hypothetical protein
MVECLANWLVLHVIDDVMGWYWYWNTSGSCYNVLLLLTCMQWDVPQRHVRVSFKKNMFCWVAGTKPSSNRQQFWPHQSAANPDCHPAILLILDEPSLPCAICRPPTLGNNRMRVTVLFDLVAEWFAAVTLFVGCGPSACPSRAPVVLIGPLWEKVNVINIVGRHIVLMLWITKKNGCA